MEDTKKFAETFYLFPGSAKRIKDIQDGTDKTVHSVKSSVLFADGRRMDVVCHGACDTASAGFSEAFLYETDGHMLAKSGLEDDYFGEWHVFHEGVLYVMLVKDTDAMTEMELLKLYTGAARHCHVNQKRENTCFNCPMARRNLCGT